MQQVGSSSAVRLWCGRSRGVEVVTVECTVVGMVVSGSKRLYHNDKIYTAQQGDIFILCQGVHQIENCPSSSGRDFEQILFYLTTEQLHQTIVMIVNSFHLECFDGHRCSICKSRNFFITTPSRQLHDFFLTIYHSFNTADNNTGEHLRYLRTPELIYHIISSDDSCMRSKLLQGADVDQVKFRSCIYDNILKDNTIETLAQQTHRSLTSFKKEFSRAFDTSPHKWFIEQRLQLAKTLLYTSDKTVSEIGNYCTFTNTSHFIRLFKQRFNITPYALKKQLQAKK